MEILNKKAMLSCDAAVNFNMYWILQYQRKYSFTADKDQKKAMLWQGNRTMPLENSIRIEIYSGIILFSLW